MKKIVLFFICVSLCWIVTTVCAREDTHQGGYMIGYPEGGKPIQQSPAYDSTGEENKMLFDVQQTSTRTQPFKDTATDNKDAMIA